jgi:PKHD-type hydroxylase
MNHDPHAYLAPYIIWENAFTSQELDSIVALGDSLRLEKAVLVYGEGGSSADDPSRITRTAWMGRAEQTAWIYERIERVIRTVNKDIWRFELSGFSDLFQYTVYYGDEGGHFDWHVDQIRQPAHRRLSASLQLSDPADYEGCDLEIQGGAKPVAMPRTRGALVVFPSYVLHRVTPISAGTRKALVVWVAGPPPR